MSLTFAQGFVCLILSFFVVAGRQMLDIMAEVRLFPLATVASINT